MNQKCSFIKQEYCTFWISVCTKLIHPTDLMSFFLFGKSADIDIRLDGSDVRQTVRVEGDDGSFQNCFLYYDGESISGTVFVRLKRPDQKLDHNGIKIEFIGQIEVNYDRGNHNDFISMCKDLAQPGELYQSAEYPFEFARVEKPYESYNGSYVKLRYFLRVTIAKRISDIVHEMDIVVHTLSVYPEASDCIKMEVGIEDCLHIEFEYNRSKYHLKDVIVGKIYFLLVRIKIKLMEIAIIKQESIGTGANVYPENTTIAKYEIMDGAPVKGESIPIRLFLSGYKLTPTMRDVNKRFSYLLMKKTDVTLSSRQEIILWRKGDNLTRKGAPFPAQSQVMAIKADGANCDGKQPVGSESVEDVPPAEPTSLSVDTNDDDSDVVPPKATTMVVASKDPNFVNKLMADLYADLFSLSSESKKKNPNINEAVEAVLPRLTSIRKSHDEKPDYSIRALMSISDAIVRPLSMACETKHPRLVQIALSAMQRLLNCNGAGSSAISTIVSSLWLLSSVEVEELKILQTVTLLVTSDDQVHDSELAKCLVICFRFNFAKDPNVVNTASATVRQLVSHVFDRAEKLNFSVFKGSEELLCQVKNNPTKPPQNCPASFGDAIMLFQDLCRLVNTENPLWLIGIFEMTRTLGLDLIEKILNDNQQLFSETAVFTFLLKESVCPLIIRLFSFNLKGVPIEGAKENLHIVESVQEKPYFPITVRLLRLVDILNCSYSKVLITECEIFLSLMIRFIDQDKLPWQRILVLELIERLVSNCDMLKRYCTAYDMQSQSTKVIKELLSAIGEFTQTIFPELSRRVQHDDSCLHVEDSVPDVGFNYDHCWLPFVSLPTHKIHKSKFLDMTDKVEPPTVPVGYFLNLAFEIVTALCSVGEKLNEPLLKSLTVMISLASRMDKTEFLAACLCMLCDCVSSSCPQHCRSKPDNADGSFSHHDHTVYSIFGEKNLLAARHLLSCSLDSGSYFGSNWIVVMKTLQNSTNNYRRSSIAFFRQQSAVAPEFQAVCRAHCRFAVNRQAHWRPSPERYSTCSLLNLMQSLRHLINETLNSSINEKESYFFIWMLLEVFLTSTSRPSNMWELVDLVIYQLCSCSKASVRVWGSFSVGKIWRTELASEDAMLDEERRSCMMHLMISSGNVSYEDVRLKLLDCILCTWRSKIKLNYPDVWFSLLTAIGTWWSDCTDDNVLRVAFQALSTVDTDYLSQLDEKCIQHFMTMATKFGEQNRDPNISLSAVEILWTTGDFLYRQSVLSEGDECEVKFPESLFLYLYSCLSKLCTDPRPPVRKSACQALFSALVSHGVRLNAKIWEIIFWEVLFPLLDKVCQFHIRASTTKDDCSVIGGTNIAVHHSRDTESKQWAETVVQTLNGIVKLFSSNVPIFLSIKQGGFYNSFTVLLNSIETLAIQGNDEVCVAAMRNFVDVMQSKPLIEVFRQFDAKNKSIDPKSKFHHLLFEAWKKVGINATAEILTLKDSDECEKLCRIRPVSFVHHLLSIFVPLFNLAVAGSLPDGDVRRMVDILKGSVLLETLADKTLLLFSPNSSSSALLSRGQDLVRGCFEEIVKYIFSAEKSSPVYISCFFDTALQFVQYAYDPPVCLKGMMTKGAKVVGNEQVAMAFCPFSEIMLQMSVSTYVKLAKWPVVISQGIAQKILHTLSTPLNMKRKCPANRTWYACVNELIRIMHATLPLAYTNRDDEQLKLVWPEMLECIQNYLFVEHVKPKTREESMQEELLACDIIEAIKTDVLPMTEYLPEQFVKQLMNVLCQGCVRRTESCDSLLNVLFNLITLRLPSDGVHSHRGLELQAICFDALLSTLCHPLAEHGHQHQQQQSSLTSGNGPSSALQQQSGSHHKLASVNCALNALFSRCKQVLTEYPERERMMRHAGVPREQVIEMVQVLSTITNMIGCFQRQPDNWEYLKDVIEQVGQLYSHLVDCIVCKEEDVQKALMQALKAYRFFVESKPFLENGTREQV
ncbi:Vacuolar protein sorting-associated protein 26B [Trichinella nativa]|uniref:Vacuolar protein sorting-associated protein 26B n=1 Tax=Trichinella nativa TaxID=6335 RepID=A0A0V1KYU6_9BILA|nr:Vacuolar protein sorting-associated protein 26B [Trichinella nativa]